MAAALRESYRFRDVVLDVTAFDLRRNGRPVRLERQPMELLILLVRRQGALVSRAEIVALLWGPDVFVDVDTGIHTAIRKIRHSLRDSVDQPSFIETVPGKGYRFVAPIVDEQPPPGPPAAPAERAPTTPEAETAAVGLVVDGRALNANATDLPVGPAASLPLDGRRRGRRRRVGRALVVATGAAVVVWFGWPRPTPPPTTVTVAVLPFETLGTDKGLGYLAEGLAEDTIVSLGRVDPSRIAVIGRTTMAAYRGTTRPLTEIGRELGADYLVESSLRAEGGRVRIAARLIRAADQVQVWTDAFDRTLHNALDLQQELSTDIAAQVLTRVTPEQTESLTPRHSRNADAYQHFLRGRSFFNQRSPEAMRHAAEEYTRAVTLDPDYALAWSGLAMSASGRAINSDADPAVVAPLARSAATRAVALAPELPEAQYALGQVLFFFDWDWPAAEVMLRRSVARDLNFSLGYQSLGHVLSQMGRHPEAEAMMRRARTLEPGDPVPHALAAQVAFQARRYADAATLATEAITLNPGLWFGHMMAAQTHAQQQQWTAALAALDVAIARSQNSKALSLRGYVLARAGRDADARRVLATLEADAASRYVPPYSMALVEAGRGRSDAAFAWLERAHAAHDVHLMYLPVDPKWDPLRADPRFASILGRCGFMRGKRSQDAER
jgi:TolB-like protein/DNA-binding winged helix-turn-helix (wHTH) protein/Flp pilus assembly protein TadD